ncbi:histidine kinase [Heyndrickxia shackletonii]|uniref:histidine kinase n=1 Tax=Heyndrickxia shackletonii TaxID=157838 RepID=A0A0Q3WXF3_9BACI|nr:PAS domain-containing sensor histidine kinase [Heyndrickxia shackletonii]KQL54850.1 histidine kinase [Heyndrickxia shackletonii]NEY99500.1 PAS domain S-box protein [Heyndrickxia shackletonii]
MEISDEKTEDRLKFAKQKNFNFKQSDELYRSLFEEAIDGIVFWDNDGNVLMANQSALRIFECSSEEFLQSNLWDFVLEKNEHFYSLLSKFYKKGEIRDELLFLMPNGQLKQLEFTSKKHFVDGSNMTIFRNASERYKMEKELRESEERFRNVFEGSFDGMVLWNRQYEIVDINPLAAQILKANRDDIIGKGIWEIIDDRFKDDIEAHIKELEQLGTSDSTLTISSENGSKYFEINSKWNLASDLSLTVIRNVTEKIGLQEQLQKSDTLSVVGELAAGIAHEIRNPMTALKGFIQLLEMSIKEDHSMYFKVIMSELRRIESTITEFLILAKPQAIQFKNNDMRKVMQETLELLNGQALMNNVQFNFKYADELPDVFCEPNQMKQVFINIIKNAIEVMPEGGFVTITIDNQPNEYIHIVIEDEGEGIPEKKIKRLGEPFYTTKERGTGLGLMVSYKIIKEHKGKVEVESEVGVGTKFHIYIPIKRN